MIVTHSIQTNRHNSRLWINWTN